MLPLLAAVPSRLCSLSRPDRHKQETQRVSSELSLGPSTKKLGAQLGERRLRESVACKGLLLGQQ